MPEQIFVKQCTRCRQIKTANLKNFPKGRRRQDLDSWCRACYRQNTALHNAKHPRGKTPDQKLIEQREREFKASEAAAAKERKADIARRMKLEAPQRQKESARKSNEKRKREVMEHYGGAICQCCGEAELLMLALDHIEGGGSKHRKAESNGAGILRGGSYTWAKKNNYPPIFRVLCHNCNFARHWTPGQICPQLAVNDLWNSLLQPLRIAA